MHGERGDAQGAHRRAFALFFLPGNVAGDPEHAGGAAFDNQGRLVDSRIPQLSVAGKIAHLIRLGFTL